MTPSVCKCLFACWLVASLAACSPSGHQSAKDLRVACGQHDTYAALKRIIFEEARRQFDGDIKFINKLEQDFSIDVDSPVAISIREDIQRVECRGRLVLNVPATNYEEFGRDTRLEEDVTFSVQASSKGNDSVYELSGFSTALMRILIAASTSAQREVATIKRQQAELDKAKHYGVPKENSEPSDDDFSQNLIN